MISQKFKALFFVLGLFFASWIILMPKQADAALTGCYNPGYNPMGPTYATIANTLCMAHIQSYCGTSNFTQTKVNRIYLDRVTMAPFTSGNYTLRLYMDGNLIATAGYLSTPSNIRILQNTNNNPTVNGWNISIVEHINPPSGSHTYYTVLTELGSTKQTNSQTVTTITSTCGSSGGGGGGGTTPPSTSLSVSAASAGCQNNSARITVSWSGGRNQRGLIYIGRTDNSTGVSELVAAPDQPNAGTGSFIDTVESGKSYRYSVGILYNDLTSAPSTNSNNVTAPTCTAPPPPPPPTISATTTTSTCSGTTPRVRIAWTTVSSAASYRIEKVAGGNTQTESMTASQAASSGYALTQNTTAGSNYHRVYALNSSGGTITSTTTTPVNIASCPAPPAADTYELFIEPVGSVDPIDPGGSRTFRARIVRYVQGNRSNSQNVSFGATGMGLTWSISSGSSFGSLVPTTENDDKETIFTANSCDPSGSPEQTVIIRAAATYQGVAPKTSSISINACNQSGSGSTDATTINGLIIGNEIELDGSNISIIYDGRIITNPPLGFSEIIVPTIREGR